MNILAEEEMKLLEKELEVLTFQEDFDLVYEKQVPNTGVALLSGELSLTRKKSMTEKLTPGHMLGVYELLHQQPVKLGCRVRKNSKIILLSKSVLETALRDPHSLLHSLVQKMAIGNG